MFVKTIKRHYDRINADESIADEDKIDALLMKLGAEFLMSQEDRVYVFQKVNSRQSLMPNMRGPIILKIMW